MPDPDRVVLVTGATGRQGGAVIRHMLLKGWKLRALTRKTNNHAAQELARSGVELVQGDLEDPASLPRAVQGAYGVYSVQDFWAVGAKREVQQGKNIADAAKKANAAPSVERNETPASLTGKANGKWRSTFAASVCQRQ